MLPANMGCFLMIFHCMSLNHKLVQVQYRNIIWPVGFLHFFETVIAIGCVVLLQTIITWFMVVFGCTVID